MNFIVAVIHAVERLEQAVSFFHNVLEFQENGRDDGWVQMENGALTVRLVPATHRYPQGELALEMETQDLPGAASLLLQQAGVSRLTGETRVSPERAEMRLRAPHGIQLTLVRHFDEDELGILPDLPSSLTWTTEADTCIKHILRFVPIIFRGLARRRVTEYAERLTVSAGKHTVDRHTALRSLVRATPAFQHERLRAELARAGIDPEPLFAEWQQERTGQTHHHAYVG